MSSDLVLVDVADDVAVITLNRPAVRNALSYELRVGLWNAVAACDQRDDVAALIVTGADPAFCAGLDLKQLGSADDREARAAADALGPQHPPRRRPVPETAKPLIGAINGPAVTGGFELALACDWLVASERASFADTHARIGVMPGWGLTVLLPQAVGVRRAREMSATGNYVDAPTALAWGLVNHVVPHDELLGFCRSMASDIGSNDRLGVQRMMRTYDDVELLAGTEAWDNEARAALDHRSRATTGPDEVAKRRAAVIDRGRSQLH